MPGGHVLAGLGVVVAGALVWASAVLMGPPPAASLQQPAEPVGTSAVDVADIDANNSPALARNPEDRGNVVLVNRVDYPRFGCRLHYSLDGGASWAATEIPQPPGTEPKCYAPDAAFSPDGTLYVSFVMLAGRGNVPSTVWTTSSADGGRSLADPVQVAGPLAFQVRLATDPTEPGRLVLTWLQAEDTGNLAFPATGYPIVMTISDDGGRTWRDPVRVSAASRQRVLAPAPQVGEDGGISVLYLDVLDDRLNYHGAHQGRGGPAYPGPWELVFARSADGLSWWEATVADDLVPIGRFIVFLPPFPALAVDGDQVYAGFHDARLGEPDVRVWTSGDGGATWGPGVRVNDNTPEDGTSQYLPRLAVAPGGRLDVVYYDRRADPDDIMNEVSLQSSFDGGRTFGPRVRLSGAAFDSRVGPGAERGLPELGSRLALQSADEVALAAWADTRHGTLEVFEQDIYRAAVTFAPVPGPGRTALRGGGVVLVATGLALLAFASVRRKAGSPPGRPREARKPARAGEAGR